MAQTDSAQGAIESAHSSPPAVVGRGLAKIDGDIAFAGLRTDRRELRGRQVGEGPVGRQGDPRLGRMAGTERQQRRESGRERGLTGAEVERRDLVTVAREETLSFVQGELWCALAQGLAVAKGAAQIAASAEAPAERPAPLGGCMRTPPYGGSTLSIVSQWRSKTKVCASAYWRTNPGTVSWVMAWRLSKSPCSL